MRFFANASITLRSVLNSLGDDKASQPEWQRERAVLSVKLGNLATFHGDLAAVKQYYADSCDIVRRLAQSNPANAKWQRDLSVSYYRFAGVLEQSGSDEAGAYWRQAHDTLAALADAGRFMSAGDRKALELLREKIGG